MQLRLYPGEGDLQLLISLALPQQHEKFPKLHEVIHKWDAGIPVGLEDWDGALQRHTTEQYELCV